MIEHILNVLLGGRGNKEESFILRENLEVNSACIVIQTLNKVFYAKSYQRIPRGEIDGKGSIDNLFAEIISSEESIMERVWCVGGFYRREIEYS